MTEELLWTHLGQLEPEDGMMWAAEPQQGQQAGEAIRYCEGIRGFAKTLDRRADHRVAETVQKAGQGLGMPEPQCSRVPALGIDPPYAPKALQENKMISDRLSELVSNSKNSTPVLTVPVSRTMPAMPHCQFAFSQIMDHMPLATFRRRVARPNGERKVRSFSCLGQFRCPALVQLTWRESLCDTEACLNRASLKALPPSIPAAVPHKRYFGFSQSEYYIPIWYFPFTSEREENALKTEKEYELRRLSIQIWTKTFP